MKASFVLGAVAATAVLIGGVSAQEARSTPGVGSGIVTVRGTVEVANMVDVRAGQAGEWRVAVGNVPDVRIANTPAVEIAGTGFATRGRRYDVTWTSGEHETIAVEEAGQSGWVRVGTSRGGHRRWVNLSSARAVEEVM